MIAIFFVFSTWLIVNMVASMIGQLVIHSVLTIIDFLYVSEIGLELCVSDILILKGLLISKCH